MKKISMGFEAKLLDEKGTFEGYAAVFDNVDHGGDKIKRGAFKASLKRSSNPPPLLWQHDSTQPIGKWTELREDEKGLIGMGQLFVDEIAKAREAFKLVKERVVSGLSIGYRVRESEYDKGGVRVLKDLDLLEISLVTFPMNDQARVQAVKTIRDFEAFLRDAGGFSKEEAKRIAARGFRADTGRDASGAADLVKEIESLSTQISRSI